MNRSENIAFSMSPESIAFYGKIQGAGAAAPVRAPTVFSATSSIGFMHSSNNFVSIVAADITRSGVGAYTVKFSDSLPVCLDVDARCWSSTGAAAYKDVYITDYNPTTRVLTFGTNLATSGAATDLLATDFVTFIFTGTKSVPTY